MESQAGQTTVVPRWDLPDLMQLPASLADTRSPSLVGGESRRGSGDDSSHAKRGVQGGQDKSPCGGPDSTLAIGGAHIICLCETLNL